MPTAGQTAYTPSGNWPDLDGSGSQGPLELQDDGQILQYSKTFRNDSDPKVGILAKLIDACDYLKKNTDASHVAAYSGAVWTIAAGTLSTFLHELADKAAKLDATIATFTGRIMIGSSAPDPGARGLGVQGNAVVGGTATISGAASVSSTMDVSGKTTVGALRVQTTSGKDHHDVDPADTTYTWQTSHGSVVQFDQWNGSGGTMTVTLPTLSGASAERYEVEFYFYPTTATHDIAFVRQAGSVNLALVNGPCYAKYRWDGTAWRAGPVFPYDAQWPTQAGTSYVGPGVQG